MRHLLPPMPARLFFANGGNGVTVFFAVSGFLITLTSLRRFGSLREMRAPVFYRIRFARIAPLLILVVTVLSVLALFHVPGFDFGTKHVPLWRAVLAVFTFHSNWLEARYGYLPACWNVMWSLSVEELFYLFFPVLCLALLRFRRDMVLFLAALLGFVVMGPFARTIWAHGNEIWSEQSYLGGMDGIALGCLTALLTHRLALRMQGRWTSRQRGLLLGVQMLGAAGLILIALGPRWIWVPLLGRTELWGTLIALGVCMVMLGSVLRSSGGSAGTGWLNRMTAPVRWYGRHSYEVYLTHEFLVIAGAYLFLHFYPNPNPHGPAPHQPSWEQLSLWFGGILALTAPLGWAVARFWSEPLNRLTRGSASRRLRGAKAPGSAATR